MRAVRPLRAIVRAVRGWLGRYRPQAWRLEGCERESGVPLCFVFAGQLENKNYIVHLAFGGRHKEQLLGRRWLWHLLPRDDVRASRLADVRIVNLPSAVLRRLHGRFRYLVPCWVGGEIEFARVTERLSRSRNAKEDLRRMRTRDMSYSVTRDRAAFEHFYTEMYVPYVRNVYGDRAFLMTREDMLSRLGHSELFAAQVRGVTLAAQIILYEAGRLRAWSIGVKDGDRANLKTGVMKALDYFMFDYLAQKGYGAVHTGASRPFLRDGALQYKKRLGLGITDYDERGFALAFSTDSAGARAFLLANPFIYRGSRTVQRCGLLGREPRCLGVSTRGTAAAV